MMRSVVGVRNTIAGIVFSLASALTPAFAADTVAPSVPGSLAATAASATQINLTWNASTDNVGVTGYQVDRCTGSSCTSFAQIATPTTNSFNDTGRAPSTTYRYRVRARDAIPNWSAFSAIVTRATPGDTTAPSVPTGLAATPTSATQINLTWTASTDNVAVTGYQVDRCAGASCTTFAQVATPTSNSFSDSGLTASTTYRYRVRARDAVPNWSAYSGIINGTTQAPPDTTAPTVPSGVAATPVSTTQINVTWAASTDAVGVTGYQVDRCTGSTCTNYAQIATPTTTSYNDTGRTAATTYRYRVRARDAVPNWSAFSSTVNATTQASDTTAPTVPTGVTATAVSATQINITWTASTDVGGVTGYQVDRCTGASCSNFVQIATPTSTSFNDTGRTASTTYRYRVRARDAVPNWSAFSSTVNATTQAAADTTAPTVPGGVSATAYSDGTIEVTWNNSTDVGGGVTGYEVDRCAGVGCTNFATVSTQSFDDFEDLPPLPSTTYRYRVRARDAVPNWSAYSTIVSATTPAQPDTTPPTAPSGVAATAISTTQIDITWIASTDAGGVTGYQVDRCAGVGCTNFVLVATPTTTSLSDAGLTASTTYRYQVRAQDTVSNWSDYSIIASATTQAPPDTIPPTVPSGVATTPISTTQINIAWSASTDAVGVTGYQVDRCAGVGCTNFTLVATPTAANFSDTGLTASTTYRYQVRARDAVPNWSAFSGAVDATTLSPPDTTPPTTPSGLTATPVSATQINLAWSAATDNVAVVGYQVDRCTGVACNNFVQIATPLGTSFSDNGRAAAISYLYRVRAMDAASNVSANSTIATGTTQSAGSALVSYSYDQLGRLSRAAGSDGVTIEYQYDANGNRTLSARTVSSAAIEIISFSPSSGGIGAQVSLYGHGFDAVAANNTVKFNGVTAAVASATPNVLVATVPIGATSGNITVAAPGGTATSPNPFVVAPVLIWDFSPVIGAAGSTVTINGSGFSSVAQNNSVTFNGLAATITSATTGRLLATVPAGATSGQIVVATSGGSATGATDFIVPPTGYVNSDVVMTGRLVTNTPGLVFSIPATNKIGLSLFSGTQNQTVSLVMTNVTMSGTFKVYRPDGVLLVTGSLANNISVDLPVLPVSGTYSIALIPSSGAGTATIAVVTEVVGSVATSGTPAPVSLQAGQHGRMSFTAAVGSYSLAMIAIAPQGPTMNATIFKPDGSLFRDCGLFYGNGSGEYGMCDFDISVAGTYTIVLNAGISAMSSQLVLAASLTGALQIDGPTVAFNGTNGQNAVYMMAGTAGQLVTLSYTNNNLWWGHTNIYKPNGQLLTSSGLFQNVPQWTADLTLPDTGTYKVEILVDHSNAGHFDLTASSLATGTILTDSTLKSLSLRSGQYGQYTFSATAGGYNLAMLSILPQNTNVLASILDPNGAVLASCGNFYGVWNGDYGTCDFTIANPGTYSVWVDIPAGPGMSMLLSLAKDITGALTIGGPSVPFTGTWGQNGRFTMTGTAGQAIALQFTNNDLWWGRAYLYAPSGSLILSTGQFYATPSWTNNVTLPESGTYTIQVLVDHGNAGHFDVRAVAQ